ncbi:unnamed protein product, partial [Brenthis ino]
MAKGKKDAIEVIEDDYSAKLDMCLTDGIIKTGSGVVLGALSSVLFLGRRRWPIIAGMGMEQISIRNKTSEVIQS